MKSQSKLNNLPDEFRKSLYNDSMVIHEDPRMSQLSKNYNETAGTLIENPDSTSPTKNYVPS